MPASYDANGAEITDVIAGPHHHIVAYLDVERDRLVVEDEAVLTYIEILCPIKLRIYVAYERISFGLGRKVLFGAQGAAERCANVGQSASRHWLYPAG
jgi:hypothetical protein